MNITNIQMESIQNEVDSFLNDSEIDIDEFLDS